MLDACDVTWSIAHNSYSGNGDDHHTCISLEWRNMSIMVSQISGKYRLFVQKVIFLWGECNGHRWILLWKRQLYGKRFHVILLTKVWKVIFKINRCKQKCCGQSPLFLYWSILIYNQFIWSLCCKDKHGTYLCLRECLMPILAMPICTLK